VSLKQEDLDLPALTEDLKEIASLSENQIAKIVRAISKNPAMILSVNTPKLASEFQLEVPVANSVRSSIIAMSRVFTEHENGSKLFRQIAGSIGLSKMQVGRVKQIIDAVESSELRKEQENLSAIRDVQYFGIPHLHSLELKTDFRVFTRTDGEKQIVPMVLATLKIHKEHESEEVDEAKVEKVVFQTAPHTIYELLKELAAFKTEMEKDIDSLTLKNE